MSDSDNIDAVSFIIQHKDIILPLYAETNSPKKTYETLIADELPALKNMAYTTFKQYLPVFVKVSDKVVENIDRDTEDKVKQIQSESDRLTHELGKVREEYESLEKSFREVSEENQALKIRLGKVREEYESLEKLFGEVRDENHALKSRSDKPLPDSEAENGSPDRIDVDGRFWSVQYKEPYFRLVKKINGKLRWLHVGRKWDSEHAKEKVRQFMAQMNPSSDV